VLVQAREWTWTKKENWKLRLGGSDIFVADATTCRMAFSLSEGARGAQRAVSCASTVELRVVDLPSCALSASFIGCLPTAYGRRAYHLLPEALSEARAHSSEKLTLLCSCSR
jgi:hypothetical protein